MQTRNEITQSLTVFLEKGVFEEPRVLMIQVGKEKGDRHKVRKTHG